jgi:hypothetical protein
VLAVQRGSIVQDRAFNYIKSYSTLSNFDAALIRISISLRHKIQFSQCYSLNSILYNEVIIMNISKELNIKIAINENCPWSGNPIEEDSLTTYKGQVVGFCNTGCRDKFEKAVDLFDDLLSAH